MDRVEQIRYFRQETTPNSRRSIIKEIQLPSNKSDDDYKYINQAILAHPELYFSKLVLLGEGDSEEIVIPQLAKIFDLDLDPLSVERVIECFHDDRKTLRLSVSRIFLRRGAVYR
jgi:putative ATP-dependent endonuclease of OLD family